MVLTPSSGWSLPIAVWRRCAWISVAFMSHSIQRMNSMTLWRHLLALFLTLHWPKVDQNPLQRAFKTPCTTNNSQMDSLMWPLQEEPKSIDACHHWQIAKALSREGLLCIILETSKCCPIGRATSKYERKLTVFLKRLTGLILSKDIVLSLEAWKKFCCHNKYYYW